MKMIKLTFLFSSVYSCSSIDLNKLFVCVFSSESGMEGEEEERAEGNSQYHVTSGGAKHSWGKTLQLHLRDEEEGQGSSGVESDEGKSVPAAEQWLNITSALALGGIPAPILSVVPIL